MPIFPSILRKFYRGRAWRELRQKKLAATRDRCEECRRPDFPWLLDLTHNDHDPANPDPDNLVLRCKRCHNRHDAVHRAATPLRTKARRTGQAPLFSDWEWWNLPAWLPDKFRRQKENHASSTDNRRGDSP